MRNSSLRRWTLVSAAVSVAAFALLVAPAASAGEQNRCAPNLPTGVALKGVFVVGEHMVPAPLGALKVEDALTLADGRVFRNGEDVPLAAAISSGVMVNAGRNTLLLVFSNGETRVLAPGEAVGAGDARCRCKCTCKDAGGATQAALFDCSSNQDTCKYNGDACVWVDDGGTLHEGTYTDCKKVWVITTVVAEP
jgi:hypothetical protein